MHAGNAFTNCMLGFGWGWYKSNLPKHPIQEFWCPDMILWVWKHCACKNGAFSFQGGFGGKLFFYTKFQLWAKCFLATPSLPCWEPSKQMLSPNSLLVSYFVCFGEEHLYGFSNYICLPGFKIPVYSTDTTALLLLTYSTITLEKLSFVFQQKWNWMDIKVCHPQPSHLRWMR